MKDEIGSSGDRGIGSSEPKSEDAKPLTTDLRCHWKFESKPCMSTGRADYSGNKPMREFAQERFNGVLVLPKETQQQ